MNDVKDLSIILESRFPLVTIETTEEARMLGVIEKSANLLGWACFSWSVVEGLRRTTRTDRVTGTNNLVDALRHGYALRGGENAHNDIDLFLVQQALGFIDGHFGFTLSINVNGHNSVTLYAAAFVDQVNGVLGPQITRIRATCGQGA